MFATGGDAMFLQLAEAVGVAIPDLVDIVMVSFKCSLAEVEW